ncbi:glycosyltransferase family 2 protein [Amycolatopsis sp. K13G38]|uniref:Glycosyltransferase family 2 protein n=2 Tax=Amycolatopsis acididurans TaxID=2724524 RepID=A0ABX1J180_9PSEU|nr:glycosyltransferase family 2 protein [Amycolatopsis acididurans]
MVEEQHEPGERLLVQRTLFAARSFLAPNEMYSQVKQGAAAQERDRLSVEPHAFVTTNTYFGRFPASYWQRCTEVTEVVIEAVVTGSGRLVVTASDIWGHVRGVDAYTASGASAETVRLTAKIDRFTDGGALWLDIETKDEPLVVEHVRWSVVAPSALRPVSIAICTHNRADYCLDTLTELAEDPDALGAVAAVHVTDQGNDAVESRDRFEPVKQAMGGKLRYVRQPNLGGAGGFTRGMYEIVQGERGAESYVLLMDDDVKLESDTVVRLMALANCAIQPILVGGQSLQELHPDRLWVDAEVADLPKLKPGLTPSEESMSGRSMVKHAQELRRDATHNAWWCCLIPAEVVAKIGYPLPVFFQWDDIEYGLRARAAGFTTFTLPGAGVWHQDLHWKDWDDWSRYFHFRNSLIVAALHGAFTPTGTASLLAKEFAETLAAMQYGLAATMIKAVEDFLRGPEVLSDGGAEIVPLVRKLRAEYAETETLRPASVAVPAAEMPIVVPEPKPSLPTLVLVKRLFDQFRNSQEHGAAIRSHNQHWWHVSRFRTAVVTDSAQTGMRVRKFDRELMLRLGREGVRTLWRLRREGEAVARQWNAAQPRLVSKQNWERLFEVDKQAGN